MKLLAAVVVVLLPMTASAQQPPPSQNIQSVVVTVGDGVVKVAPDQASIIVTAESRGATPREAQQKNTMAMKPVQDRLHSAGIAADAIKTISYEVQPDWDYRNAKIRGYVARNSMSVRIDDVDRVGELVDMVVMAGATSVSSIRFDVKERERIEREALRMAVADARARAAAAAGGAGLSVDRILRIEETSTNPSPPMYRQLQETVTVAPAGPPPPTPPIEAGEIEIRSHVTVTTLLK